MNCRCGSEEDLEYVDGKFVNQDGKPHVCLNNTTKLPSIPIELEKMGVEISTKMYQLKMAINENIKQYEVDPNQGMIWEMTKIIFSKYNS